MRRPFACPGRFAGTGSRMESTPDESDAGYPEEAPSEVTPDNEGDEREGGRDREGETDAPDNEDGTATGNPNAAG